MKKKLDDFGDEFQPRKWGFLANLAITAIVSTVLAVVWLFFGFSVNR